MSRRVFTFDEVQKEVQSGRSLLIYERKVYDVTKWKAIHPGGELTIQHMVGRDATDQILTNHSAEVLAKYMKLFIVGDLVDENAKSVYYDRPLSLGFRDLHRKMGDEGLFVTRPFFYARLYACIIAVWLTSIAILWNFGDSLLGCTVAGIFLACFWHQSAGVMHDTGHNAISQNRLIDTLVGVLFTNCFTGFSVGWWKATHFIHHLVTNDPEHDPHIQLLPFIAITTRFFDSVYSSFYKKVFPYDSFAKVMVPIQHITYLPLMCVARFVIYKDGVVHLLKHRGSLWRIELAAIAFFWTYFFSMISMIPDPRLRVYFFFFPVFLLIILQLQLFVSHNAMSTDPMGKEEDYVTYQLRTTMDYYCDEWFDWFHGGLQFQVAHHFFPRMPRHNLRQATEFVLQFVKDNNLTYHMMSFTGGNVNLLRHLKAIAEEAKFLAASAKDQVEFIKSCKLRDDNSANVDRDCPTKRSEK